jgi:hypothetical protein
LPVPWARQAEGFGADRSFILSLLELISAHGKFQ